MKKVHFTDKCSIFAVGVTRMIQGLQKQKVYWVWLLAVIFILPYTLKSLHICHCEPAVCAEVVGCCCDCDDDVCNCCDEGQEHDGHNPADCLLCQFTLYSFLYPTEQPPIATSYSYFTYPVYLVEKQYETTVTSRYLRGPPVVDPSHV